MAFLNANPSLWSIFFSHARPPHSTFNQRRIQKFFEGRFNFFFTNWRNFTKRKMFWHPTVPPGYAPAFSYNVYNWIENCFLCFMPTATNKQPTIHLTLHISALLKIFLHLLQGQIQLFGIKFCSFFFVCAFSSRILLLFGMYY